MTLYDPLNDSVFSRVRASLHFALSVVGLLVRRSVTSLNFERFDIFLTYLTFFLTFFFFFFTFFLLFLTFLTFQHVLLFARAVSLSPKVSPVPNPNPKTILTLTLTPNSPLTLTLIHNCLDGLKNERSEMIVQLYRPGLFTKRLTRHFNCLSMRFDGTKRFAFCFCISSRRSFCIAAKLGEKLLKKLSRPQNFSI